MVFSVGHFSLLLVLHGQERQPSGELCFTVAVRPSMIVAFGELTASHHWAKHKRFVFASAG